MKKSKKSIEERSSSALVFNQLLQNTVLLTRSAYQKNFLDPEGRNLDKECGYPEGEPSTDLYKYLYERYGIATRVVNVYPEESWSMYPTVTETEENRITKFERAWKRHVYQMDPFSFMQRTDELSGVLTFGLLLIGFNDGRSYDKPVDGIGPDGEKVARRSKKPAKVLFLQTFPEHLVEIVEVETRKSSPRCGLPVMYRITVNSPEDQVLPEGEPLTETDMLVHWTRVIHVADNCKSSNVHGTPRLKSVLPFVLDCRKILGSSGEMFWKGGFPGISLEAFPELAVTGELDSASAKAELEAYQNGLQRYLRLVGMTAKSLAPQVSDPSPHLTQNILFICATIGVPVPVFLGQIEGHAAGDQNMTNWNRRLGKRQNFHLTPHMVKPYIWRLQQAEVLPETPNGFTTEWRDMNTISQADRAKISLQKSQAILQYITSGSYNLIPPRKFMTLVLEFTPEEVDGIVQDAGGEDRILSKLEKMASAMAGNTRASAGTNPERGTGAAGKRNGLGKAKKR